MIINKRASDSENQPRGRTRRAVLPIFAQPTRSPQRSALAPRPRTVSSQNYRRTSDWRVSRRRPNTAALLPTGVVESFAPGRT